MANHDADVVLKVDLDTSQVQSQADQLRGRIESIFRKTDGKQMSASFVRLKQNMRDLYTESSKVGAELDRLNRFSFKVVKTDEFKRAEEDIKRFQAQVNKLDEQMSREQAVHGTNTVRYNMLSYDYQQAQNALANAKLEWKQINAEGRAYKEILMSSTPEYQELLQRQAQINDRMQIAVLRAGEMQGAVSKSVHPFKDMHNAIVKVGHAISKVVGWVKNLANHLRGVKSGMDDTQKSMRNLLKFALKYFLGLRSIFILYKRIRSAGVEAYKGLASQFPELNAELNELKNSFFQLKNSIATMAQPILSYLVPAIKTLMGWLSAAMTALANFFAILTGAKYIYKATKLNKDWAKSAKGAGKAAKEANEDIAEYDNLILIQQDKDSGGGGGGGAADDYAGAFEKVEAESDFAQKLKEAINAGNWEEVGNLFAKKLNGVVDTFDNWLNNTFRPKGKMWADRIGRILNGLTDGFNAKKLGNTLADGVNAIFDIFNTFLKRYNFKKLGTRVGEAITGFFTRLDPKLIGNTLANRFNAAINFWGGLIKSTDFKVIGSRIGVALKTLIEDIQWAELGANLSNLAAGILEGLSQFIIDSDLGVTVGNAINEFLSKIDFGRLMRDLSDLAINLLNALADAIETVDWEMVGQAIADMLKNIDWGRFLSALLRVALGLIKGLGTALLQIATDHEALGSLATGLLAIFGAKWLWGKITGIFKTGLTSAIGSAAGSVSASGVGGLGAAIAGIATFEGVGRTAGALGSVIAYNLFGDDEMAEYYEEFSKKPIQYTVQAVAEAVSAAQEYSETTGKKTLANAWSMMWGGDDVTEIAKEKAEEMQKASRDAFKRAQLGWDTEKGGLGLGRDVTDTEWFAYRYGEAVDQIKEISGELASNTESTFSGVGRAINNMATEMQGAVDAGRASLGMYQTDSNHYAEIAQANSKLVTDTAKVAEESSNHYAEIAKKNSGYYDKIKEEAVKTSDHYAQIAQANAKAIESTTKETESIVLEFDTNVEIANKNATMSYDELTKKLQEDAAGVSEYYNTVKQNRDEAIASSNHYVEIAQANAKKQEDSFTSLGLKGHNTLNSLSMDAVGTHDAIVKQMEDAKNKSVTAFDGMESEFTSMSDGIKDSVATVPDSFSNTFTDAYNKVTDSFSQTKSFFGTVAESVKTPFGTMADYFHDTFSDSWNGVVDVFSSNSPEFKTIQDSISGSFKTVINGMITGVNNSITTPFRTLSSLIEKMRGLTVGDSKVFSSLPGIHVPTIPKLAQGAVLPPNNPFIAMVGDQKSGTNVEAPLETIAEALRQVLSETQTTQNQTIVLQLNGRQIAQAVWDEENKRYKQTGARFSFS